MTTVALTLNRARQTLRPVRIVLRVLLVIVAACWVTAAWSFQYLLVIPFLYLARFAKACLAMGVYAFLLFIPVIGWVVLGALIVRRGPARRPIPWRRRVRWPRWAGVKA